MRAAVMWGAALFQGLILVIMAGEREWVVRHGRVVYLRTAPVDPRDMMRGDYVRMEYEISQVPRSLCVGRLAEGGPASLPRDMRVYATLQPGEGGVAGLATLADQRPGEGLFVRGRLENATPRSVSVRYGLEAYFMEQGRAWDLEQGRVQGGARVPLEMEVAVSGGGLAVLKGHRWGALGIGLELETRQQTNDPARPVRLAVAARVWLLNASTQEVAVVDLAAAGCLALVADQRWGENPWRWVGEGTKAGVPKPEQIVVLRPGQSLTNRVDFGLPTWHVTGSNLSAQATRGPKPLFDAELGWSGRFRLVYQPPDAPSCRGLPHEDRIWHGRLQSRAFSGAGVVD